MKLKNRKLLGIILTKVIIKKIRRFEKDAQLSGLTDRLILIELKKYTFESRF
jgi:hypothetical protein